MGAVHGCRQIGFVQHDPQRYGYPWLTLQTASEQVLLSLTSSADFQQHSAYTMKRRMCKGGMHGVMSSKCTLTMHKFGVCACEKLEIAAACCYIAR